jgi:signal peptidase I
LIRSPKRWEIHFFYDEEGTPVAKRIVGLPGERISIKNKRILVNGLPVELPRSLSTLKYYPFGNLAAGREVDCGNGYFVLGDDSRDSHDSRFVGPIEERRFRGRVWCVLWPWSRAGFVTVSENRKTAGGKVVSLEDIPRVARASQSRACGTE